LNANTVKIEPEFDFIGGHLCLDFVNTFGGLPLDSLSQERLTSYPDLIAWSCQASLMSDSEANHLLSKAVSAGAEAAAILDRALALREAIFRIFVAVTLDTQPTESDLVLLNRELERGMAGAQVMVTPNGYSWEWRKEQQAFDQMLGPIARSAAMLLTSDERKLVRKCACADCRWLYVDTTKNHSRQWCKSTSCGNRARVRRHREKQLIKEVE
jgi:predicted RNA-binding Zn ribbon-like protein